MLHKLAIPAIAAIAFALPMSSAQAGIGHKVTGGAETIIGGAQGDIEFGVTVNAIQQLDKDGIEKDLKGSIQFSREDPDGSALFVHAPIDCLSVSEDGTKATVSGPAVVQENTVANVTPLTRLLVGIQEDGTGAGDNVYVNFTDSTDCPIQSNYGGDVIEGEFKIRKAD